MCSLNSWILSLAILLSVISPRLSYSYLLTTTTSGNLMFEYLGGEAGPSNLEFGIGSPSVDSVLADRNIVFQINNWTNSIYPHNVVDKGYYLAGSQLDFYNISDYNSNLYAFSSRLTTSPSLADLAAFSDTDNSLNWGGSIVETIDFNHWVLHLDDAWSYLYDDDDNEMLIKVWVDTSTMPPAIPAPEPSTLILLGIGLFGLAVTKFFLMGMR